MGGRKEGMGNGPQILWTVESGAGQEFCLEEAIERPCGDLRNRAEEDGSRARAQLLSAKERSVN